MIAEIYAAYGGRPRGGGAALILMGIGLALATPGGADAQTTAQQIFQVQADSLRAQLVCRPPVEWPDLPRRPKSVPIEASVDSAGVISYLGVSVVVATRVDLPQYASFLNPTSEVCEPVIILEEDGVGNFVYARPLQKTAGTAPIVYFVLLGEDPPTLPAPAPESGPER